MEVVAKLEEVEPRPGEVRCPGERLDGVRRLLVARTDRLGDVVLTLPALDILRRAYPDAELELLVAPGVVELASCFDGVDRVHAAPTDGAGLTALLQRRGPDAVLCVARDGRLAVSATRARIRHRLGTGRRFYSPLFTRRVDEGRRGGGRHEVEYALSFAHRAGAPAAPARFGLALPAAADASAAAWLAARNRPAAGFVVLHPGSGGSCPRWPVERFRELAALLEERGAEVVWSAGPGEPSPSASDTFAGTLPELAALLKRAAGIVSSSTGPLHLAVAVGRPALALHAPWPGCSVRRWGPYGAGGAGIVATAPGAEVWSRRRRAEGAVELMAGVPARFVFDEACRRFRLGAS